MAGFIIEFKNEEQYGELMSKLHKAKKAICEAFDAMEEADPSEMNERNYYRGDYRGYGGYRERGYRDDYENERMNMRRDSRGRYA